jgi:hypothetical protein
MIASEGSKESNPHSLASTRGMEYRPVDGITVMPA